MLKKSVNDVIEKSEPINKKGQDTVSFQIPRFTLPRSTNAYLVLTLVIFAFILGMLTNKVMYLEKNATNPQTVTAAQNTQQAAAPQAAQQPQPTLGKQNVTVGNYPPKGDTNAKVTIVAFEDFRCPFCQKTFNDVEPQLQKEYIDTGKVKFYYRNYQFLGPASVVAGNGGECANDQGKFWDFHDYMYKNQPSESDISMYTADKLTDIAAQLGMDATQFRQCMDSKKFDKNVSQDLADGQKVGVNGTPTYYINGTQLVGAQPFSAFKTIIDQELSK